MISCIIFVVIKGSYYFNIFIITCIIFALYEWFNLSKKNLVLFLSGSLFLIFSFYISFVIRNFGDTDSYNSYIFFLILLISISSDLGGFIFGKILKGPKLTKISPNKTFSGVLGAYLLTFLSSYLYIKILSSYFPSQSVLKINFIIIFILSSISQIGDLIVSYFKRLSNIKDTGNLIPGHGGILDRIDGIIFLFPFAYYFLKIGLI